MSRCMLFPPPGYLWNGVGGEALMQLIKLNSDRERKKQKRRRKEKRKRKKNLETAEKVKSVQPMELLLQDDSSENFQIIKRTKALKLHPNGQHDHGYGAKSFCSKSMIIDVGFLPCIFELKKCMHQVLSSKQIDILQQRMGSRPFCKFHSPYKQLEDTYEGGSLLIDSQFRELIINWVPPPLDTPSTELSDQQWLYDRRPLRNDINQKTNAVSNDRIWYPYTSLF